MEKHEQITLAGLGYVIGFTTAFIGFALTDDNYKETKHVEYRDGNYGLVETAAGSNGSAQGAIVDAAVNNDGLFAKIGDKERIVSAGAISPNGQVAGFHYAVSEIAVSPNQQFLFYCVQAQPEDAECRSYIYEASSDSVYPVKNTNTDTYVRTSIDSANASWSNDNLLSIDGLVSASASEPWMVE